MSILHRSFLLLVAGAPLVISGCADRAIRKMAVPESKSIAEVSKASEEVLRSRYYQVKILAPEHIVALAPIELGANTQTRQRIDVWIWLENGYFMPNVFVETYMDTGEPPMNRNPATITPRFPIEKAFVTPPNAEWREVYYDRTLALEIRNQILDRLSIREPSAPSPAPTT